MSARFFIEGVHQRGDRVRIDDTDAHHIRDVLRLRAGDDIEIIDSASQAFVARLASSGEQLFATLVQRREPLPARRLRVDVAQAMPKAAKMDFIVEKATELGAGAIIPFSSERTIARPGAQRVARWRRVAKSAAEQCGRRDVPTITEPAAFATVLDRFCSYDVVLFAWESADDVPLRERLPALVAQAHAVLVVIGPEGGFTPAELDVLRAHPLVTFASLGPLVLRAETAAIAGLARLQGAGRG